MKTITSETMSVDSVTTITIADVKVGACIEAVVHFTFLLEQDGGIGDRMENAIRGSEEVTIDSVDLTITLYVPGANAPHIQFVSTSIDFYEEHFGELEVEDVVGYV